MGADRLDDLSESCQRELIGRLIKQAQFQGGAESAPQLDVTFEDGFRSGETAQNERDLALIGKFFEPI